MRILLAMAATLAFAAPTSAYDVSGCRYRPQTSNVRHGPAKKVVALTFDDGPSDYTARLLDILAAEHVKATFFVEGQFVAGHEALMQRELAEGHMIGNHSWDHPSLAKADATARDQIDRTQAAIRAATGFTPCLIRPPFGHTTKKLLRVVNRRRLTSILWSVSPSDYRRPGSSVIRRRVLRGVKPGAIVLLHDGGGNRDQTLKAVPGIIDTLRDRGYRFVTVTALLGMPTV